MSTNRYVFALSTFYSSIADRHIVVGQRVRADDDVVRAHPESFRTFSPPTLED